VLMGAGMVAGYSLATFSRAPARNDSRILACMDSGGPLRLLLRRARPQSFYYLPSLGGIEAKNVGLLGEWLEVRYRKLPIGTRVAILSDADGRLDAEVVDRPPGEWPAWLKLTFQR